MKNSQTINRLRAIFLMMPLILLPVFASAAELSLLHKPPALEELPAPGIPLALRVQVKGLTNPDPEVRLYMVIDGRLSDEPLKGTYDLNDNVVYEGDFRAPLADVSYQFVLTNADGSTVVSKRYHLQRPCIPNMVMTDEKIDLSIAKEERVRVLLDKARGLERDIQAYNNAVEILKELQKQEPGEKSQ